MESAATSSCLLILLALILSVGAYVIVGLADNRCLRGRSAYGITLTALFIGAHLVLRWKAPRPTRCCCRRRRC